ncbi:hypothetical protein V8G54_036040 [Vigna mungo]|uniref:Uncharacterized protein n=1 Tax=Vigna mungo TaxID=3915 RepID=A0AAQ3MG04_VIGMU
MGQAQTLLGFLLFPSHLVQYRGSPWRQQLLLQQTITLIHRSQLLPQNSNNNPHTASHQIFFFPLKNETETERKKKGNFKNGRTPGSKNKPKPPMMITRESANTLHAHILDEVGSGCDVFNSVASYVWR